MKKVLTLLAIVSMFAFVTIRTVDNKNRQEDSQSSLKLPQAGAASTLPDTLINTVDKSQSIN